jgi:hypothetical protein
MVSVPGLIASIISNFFTGIAVYLPTFIAGLIVLLIGLVIAEIIKQSILGLSDLVKVEKWAADAKLASAHDIKVWPRLLAELLRWTVVILFLVGAVEVWGVKSVGEVLNQLLLYLPNVFVAVVMGLVGMVVGNLLYDIVRHGAKGVGHTSGGTIATMARYVVFVFTGLLVLHQLGVAADLIQILFTGIVAMLALAGGLAFGLGGQDTAKKILKELTEKLEK